MPRARRAVVLGGGIAGIAAAFGLRDRGFDVTLLESRGWLGGRAFSFDDRRKGLGGADELCDNGPHVMLGCYDAMRRLLRRLGTEGGFEVGETLRLSYWGEGGARWRLRLSGLPTAAAMPLALWSLPLGIGGRARAAWGLGQVLLGAPEKWTLQDWIERKRQTGAPARFLWEPLCRAVMNSEPRDVEARLFLGTLRQAFLGSAARAGIWIPKRPWLELVGVPSRRSLEDAGVQVRMGCRVRRVADAGDGGTTVELASGEVESVAARDGVVVSAMPWRALHKVLDGGVPHVEQLGGMPLVSIYFRCDDERAPEVGANLVALVGGEPFHFLCRVPGDPPGRFALLAGGCRSFDGVSVAEIEAVARTQLARFDPRWDPQTPATVRVVKENRATITAAPGVGRVRPEPGRWARNLFVCGDWTQVQLPSTLEGAARSGERVAVAAAES